MPLCVLLWIVILLPVIFWLWCVFASVTKMDADAGITVAVCILLASMLVTPQLLWYKSVRNAMFPSIPAPVLVEAPR